MNKFDKNWSEINQASNALFCITPFSPKPLAKPRSLFGRIVKTAYVFVTTKYRLSTAWVVAKG